MEFKDVYVTDHKLVPEKLNTQNEDEDLDFYEYQKSLQEYNSSGSAESKVGGASRPRFERGSILQRIIDPLAGAPVDENGSVVYTVEDKELDHLLLNGDESKLREQFEKFKAKGEVWDMDEEEYDSFRQALFEELRENNTMFKPEDFEKVLVKELGVF